MTPQSTEADPVSLHLEGMRFFQAGKREEGLSLVRRAVDMAPGDPILRFNLATLFHALRDLPQAEAACREGLALDPDHAIGNNNLGGVLLEMGKPQEAEEFLRRAIRKDRSYPDPLFNLGLLLCRQNRWEEAASILSTAIRLQPDHTRGAMNLGAALINLGRFEEALPHARKAASSLPGDAKAQYNLGTALHKLHRHAQAEPFFREAVRLQDDFAQAHGNLGICLIKLRRREEAEACLRRAAALDASIPFVWNGVGLVELAKGNFDAALEGFDRAIAIAPQTPEAHFNRGCLLLMQRDFARGWDEYLGVRNCSDHPSASRFQGSFWDGSAVDGPVILQGEQGFGDTIQFVRYASLVKERAKEVVLECPAPLVKLMKTARGVDRVIARGNSLPKGATRVPLLNLPRIFGTDAKSIPATIPYLSPSGPLPEPIAQALANAHGKKIGLCWQGNPNHPEDDRRSLPPESLRRLRGVAGAHFFSLQKGFGAEAAASLSNDLPLTDLAPSFGDFHDTARAIQELDLVISVDTSIAHLAGALGKPVWLLVAFVPEWRWMRDRDDSPWYPTMRLFRQKSLGDWTGVMKEIRKALSA